MLKIFKSGYFSIVTIILGLLLVLAYQYAYGAKLVYFLPNTNVYIYGMTLNTCQQYGSCLYLINSTDIRYVSYIFLLIIIYYAYLSAVAETVLKRGISFFILVVSYILVANAAGLAWFHKCAEFCGVEYLFYWIFPTAVFIAEIINNNSEKTINNTKEN